jgi:hypothetical protein
MVMQDGTAPTVKREHNMTDKNINEYKKEPQIMTKEFLEDLSRRGKEQNKVLDKLLEELRVELGIPDENK